MRPERIELPTFRSGGERATNCAMTPKLYTQAFSVVLNFLYSTILIVVFDHHAPTFSPIFWLQKHAS